MPSASELTLVCVVDPVSFSVEAMVRGYHIYKDIWATVLGCRVAMPEGSRQLGQYFRCSRGPNFHCGHKGIIAMGLTEEYNDPPRAGKTSMVLK